MLPIWRPLFRFLCALYLARLILTGSELTPHGIFSRKDRFLYSENALKQIIYATGRLTEVSRLLTDAPPCETRQILLQIVSGGSIDKMPSFIECGMG
jgi:hypothetical protein